jgi:succinate dehydrogenase/fumarate reductase flavoprotein subunit
MWEEVGPSRSKTGLLKALATFEEIENEAEDLRVAKVKTYNQEVLDTIELRSMLKVAKAIALSSLVREESRGTHVRTDFPDAQEALRLRSVIAFEEHGKVETRMEENSAWKAPHRR